MTDEALIDTIDKARYQWLVNFGRGPRTCGEAILAALREQWAIVKLLKPDGGDSLDEDGQVFFDDYSIRVDCTGRHRPFDIITDFGMGTEFRTTLSPQSARSLAAALLAAADKAEDK